MLAAQRQSWILEEVRRIGGVRVSDLTQALGVSDMTVRRDLDMLARKGLIEKVHGGATARPHVCGRGLQNLRDHRLQRSAWWPPSNILNMSIFGV